MTGYNFYEQIRRVLANARKEAAKFEHATVQPEHLLLALIAERDGVAVRILAEHAVHIDELRERIVEKLPPANPAATAVTDLPYTGPAKRILELSMSEALFLGHSYVDTEHLLAALAQGAGHTRELLTNVGLDIETVRISMRRILDDPPAR